MKKFGLYLMAAVYMAAGIYHFVNPRIYVAIMPDWIPWHLELVYISGVFEFVLGAMLLFRPTRRLAGWGLIALLIAIYPANIQMTIDYYNEGSPRFWLSVLRLPLQFLLIWWAYKVARRKKGGDEGMR